MKTTNPVTQKYAKIREGGRRAYQDGTVKNFAGFPESLKKRISMLLSFDAESSSRIEAVPAKLVSDNRSYRFLVASRDFPLHTTLLEGEASVEVNVFSDTLQKLRNDVSEDLLGQEVVFDQLIADAGGSIILAATEIPECVLDARMLIVESYQSEGLKVLPLDNILHSTQVRVVGFADDAKLLSVFHHEIEETNSQLEQKPIVARIAEVALCQAYAFLNSFNMKTG